MQKQQVIIYARQSQPPVSKEIEQSLLRGHITCGYCERPLGIVGSEYRCSTKSYEECRSVAIAIDTIDAAAWDATTKQLEQRDITLFSPYEPIGEEMGEVLEMLNIPVVDEPTSEEKRQVLEILGVAVTLFAEDDPAHNRYEIKFKEIISVNQ